MTKNHSQSKRSNIGKPSVTEPCASVELTDEHKGAAECSTLSSPEHDREEAIRSLAHNKWIVAGCPEGDGVDHWLEAEQEVLIGKTDA